MLGGDNVCYCCSACDHHMIAEFAEPRISVPLCPSCTWWGLGTIRSISLLIFYMQSSCLQIIVCVGIGLIARYTSAASGLFLHSVHV